MIGIASAAALAVGIPAGIAAQRIHRNLRRQRLMRAPLPPAREEIARQGVALYRLLPDELKPQLHGHMQNFLREKPFEGCGGIAVTEEMRVTVAALASLLLLNRPCTYFPRCDAILVYPSAYVAAQTTSLGPVRVEEPSVRLGESSTRGIVVLAWDSVQRDARDAHGDNVVLHEFAHQLDQEDGRGDGAPILSSRAAYADWHRVFSAAYEELRRHAEHGRRDVLRPYGATNPAEFFAVATEAFFGRARELRERHAELYGQLASYYRLDPAAWTGT